MLARTATRPCPPLDCFPSHYGRCIVYHVLDLPPVPEQRLADSLGADSILVVDDEKDVRNVLASFLAEQR